MPCTRGGAQAFGDLVFFLRVGEAHDFELLGVMAGNNAAERKRGGLAAKMRANIADPQLPVGIGRIAMIAGGRLQILITLAETQPLGLMIGSRRRSIKVKRKDQVATCI